MKGIAPSGTALDKTKSTGQNQRAEQERGRKENQDIVRFAEICSTPEGREQMKRQLRERFCDPKYGNKAWLKAMETAKQAIMHGNLQKANQYFNKAKRKENEFAAEMKDGTYWLHRANRQAAILNDRPISYDRLALCYVSVFALSHWRNEVTVKHYMI